MRGRKGSTKNLLGKKFGLWSVIGPWEKRQVGTQGQCKIYWLCSCKCDVKRWIPASHLINDYTFGCQKCRNACRLPFGEAAYNHLYASYQIKAKGRKFEWSLSKDEFKTLVNSNCHYCGLPPSNVYKSKRGKQREEGNKGNGDFVYSGVDRVKNEVGYVLGNVVPCCMECNMAKKITPVDSFLSWIDRVYTYQKMARIASSSEVDDGRTEN